MGVEHLDGQRGGAVINQTGWQAHFETPEMRRFVEQFITLPMETKRVFFERAAFRKAESTSLWAAFGVVRQLDSLAWLSMRALPSFGGVENEMRDFDIRHRKHMVSPAREASYGSAAGAKGPRRPGTVGGASPYGGYPSEEEPYVPADAGGSGPYGTVYTPLGISAIRPATSMGVPFPGYDEDGQFAGVPRAASVPPPSRAEVLAMEAEEARQGVAAREMARYHSQRPYTDLDYERDEEDLRRAERLAMAAHRAQRSTSLRGPAASPTAGPMAKATSRDGHGGGRRGVPLEAPRRSTRDFMAVSGASTLPSLARPSPSSKPRSGARSPPRAHGREGRPRSRSGSRTDRSTTRNSTIS